MMTKIKSGLAAQIKALVVIPAAIFMFFFFAEITLAQEAVGFQNKDLTNELQGFWKNIDEDTYGQLLNFKGNDLQILEDINSYREIQYQFPVGMVSETKESFKESAISKHMNSIKELRVFQTIPSKSGEAKSIKIVIKNDKLIIGWTQEQVSIYTKLKAKNSLESFSKSINDDFEPTSASYYRISENPDKTFFLLMNKKGQMLLNGEKVDFQNIQIKIKEIKSLGNPFDAAEKLPIIIIDARCKMAYVNEMFRKLREMDELRHILSVKPFDEKVPEIFYHNVGIPRLLPPKDAKPLDEEEVKKNGMKIIRMDLSKGNMTSKKAASTFDNEIQKDKKYIVLYIYKNETSYKEYLSVLDEFYKTIFTKRNSLAIEKYNLGYDDLAKAQQREVRKSYPLVLTERNVDDVE